MATTLLPSRATDAPSAPAPIPARPGGTALALAAWCALIGVAHIWGDRLLAGGRHLELELPPLRGSLDPRFGLGALPAVALGTAAVIWGPALAARLPWRRLLVASALAAAAFAVALAVVDGPGGLTGPLLGRGEYIHDIGAVGSPGAFLSTFVERLLTYHIHTQAHPPGMVLVLWALAKTGLGRPGWAAALCIAGGAAAVPAVLVSLRAIAGDGEEGEARARMAAPFLAFAPAAVWVATTADAFYAGLAAWGVACLALAVRPRPRRSDALAAAGGLLLAGVAFCTYGAVALAPIAIAVVMTGTRRPWRPLLIAGLAGGAVAGAFAAAGFWWLDGLNATRALYAAGVAAQRPYAYFLLANLAAFALVVGPATAVALPRLRGRGAWLLAGAALAAVTLADVSGLSKAEVERIWLPFAPFVLVATYALATRATRPIRAAQGWLGLQVTAALALQLVVRTKW